MAQDKILIVDDDRHMRSALNLSLKKLGKDGEIFSSAEDALKFIDGAGKGGEESPFFLIVSDLNLPNMDGVAFLEEIKKRENYKNIPFVIITAYGTIESAVLAMKLGATDYLLKPFNITDFERVIKNAEKISHILTKEVKNIETLSYNGDKHNGDKHAFIYKTGKMKQINSFIGIIAPSDATVLITGESGTGKEVVARSIHELSKRKGKFIGVNCSAIVPTLLESELFGHEKGAFTGAAARKPGKLELANNGTILLDEIADMDKNLQSKILRTLQEKTVDRVGGDEPVKVDVRIIAATNRDIEKMVSEGAFREDLFYRINVIPIHLPPLRERKEDIPPLAKYFMEKYSKKYYRNCIKISEDALNYLVSLNYQGNIRELENMIERAVILAQKDEIIDIAHFGSFGSPGYNGPAAIPKAISEARVHQSMSLMRAGDGEAVSRENESGITSLSIKEMEKKLIIAALKETNGNRTKAAEKLGITARTLRNKLKELNLSDV